MTSGDRNANKGLSKAALLAAGAFSAWCFAPQPEAHATCTVFGTGTVGNVGSNSDVECTGVNSGVTVQSINSSPGFNLDTNATFDGSAVYFTPSAIGGSAQLQSGASADQSVFILEGDNSLIGLYGATLTASGPIALMGANGTFEAHAGSSVDFTSGWMLQVSGADSFIGIYGASINGDLSSSAVATIIGGAGSQEFQINGGVAAGGSGVAIAMMDGDDLVTLFDQAQVQGSIDGGTGQDEMQLVGTHSEDFNSTGIEHLTVFNGADWTLAGSHQFTLLDIDGTLRGSTSTVLGASNAVIDLGVDGLLVWSSTGQFIFGRTLTGDGVLEYDGGGDLVFSNTNAAFGGQIVITDGTVIINNGAAFGAGSVVNNDVLRIGNVSFATAISGSGVVEKTASGVGVLSGVNTYSGGTSIIGGTLQVTNAGALGTGGVSLGMGTSLDIQITTGQEIFGNVLSGQGALVKSGAGTVVFSNTNTYAGGTTISQGTIVLNNGDALGTGALVNNGLLRIGGITFANNISGSGGVEKTASNVGTLTGTNTFSGGVSVLGGTLRAGLASLGTGQISLASGTTFDLLLPANGALTNAVAADANSLFRVQGGGVLTLAAGTFGNLDVTAGGLHVTGPITVAGPQGLRVSNGAYLSGTGAITGDVVNAGILGPGASVGTLTIDGNYVHETTGVLEIEFGPGSAIDLLDISGAATINGGTLRLLSLGGADGSGMTFLQADGGVTGQFATIEVPNGGAAAVVLYEANSVMIPPTVATARPSTINSQMALTGQSFAEFVSILGDEIREGEGRSIWGRAMANAEERDAAGASLGYSFDTNGAAGGFRVNGENGVSFGVAIASSNGEADLDSGAGSTEVEGVLGALSVDWRNDRAFVGGGVVFGNQDFSTDRVVEFNNITDTLHGESQATTAGAYVAGGVRGEANGWDVWASAQASYLSNTIDGYEEDGANVLRVAVEEFEAQNATIDLQVGAQRRFVLENGAGVTPHVRAGVVGDLALDDRSVEVSFPTSNQSAMLKGDGLERVFGAVGAGLSIDVTERAEISIDLRHLAGEDASRSMGSIGARIRF